eukprot:9483338-Pyramimonas_sp.AAC.2
MSFLSDATQGHTSTPRFRGVSPGQDLGFLAREMLCRPGPASPCRQVQEYLVPQGLGGAGGDTRIVKNTSHTYTTTLRVIRR